MLIDFPNSNFSCFRSAPVARSELHRIKAEQERINRLLEASEINLGDIAERFEQLVQLIEKAPETYALTDNTGRRTLNQFFFDKVYIRDDEINDTSHGDLINFVLDTDRPTLLRQQATKMRQERPRSRAEKERTRDRNGPGFEH